MTAASTTTVTAPTSSSIAIGTSNTDGVTVTGNAAGGSPTGSVSFYECGPTLTPTACTSQANQVGSAVNLSAGPNNTATATSGSFTPNATGYWCFAGYYSGDSNYSTSSDTTVDECFDVITASTSTSTAPTTSTITLGSTDTDGATVNGNAVNGSPTGSVTFYECGPTPSPTACTSQTNQVGNAVNLSPGANNTATGTSASFTPNATGYWCFAGYYSGDSNYSTSSDTSTDECFDVTAAASATATTPSNSSITVGSGNTDGVTVTGNAAGGSPTGSVTFYECGPTLTPTACTSQANPVGSAVGVTAGPNNTATATSASFTPDATGYWCFAGYYSGDSNYNTSSDTSTGECFNVTASAAPTATAPTSSTITLGSTDTDGATVTGDPTNGSPTGAVSFYECGPTLTPTACTSKTNQVGSAVGLTAGPNNKATATSASFTPNAIGYWCFAGYYSGDSNYGSSSDTSTNECFDVTAASTSTGTAPTTSTITLGSTDTDGATIFGNATGGSPTGSVTFYECGPTPSPTACTSQTNQVGTRSTSARGQTTRRRPRARRSPRIQPATGASPATTRVTRTTTRAPTPPPTSASM